MPCRTFKHGVAQPVTVIACSRGTRQRCQTPGCTGDSVALCDFELGGEKKGQTCDRRMCSRCRNQRGPNVDYCAAHSKVVVGQTGGR